MTLFSQVSRQFTAQNQLSLMSATTCFWLSIQEATPFFFSLISVPPMTVEHTILINHLKHGLSIESMQLDLFSSYFAKMFLVSIDHFSSPHMLISSTVSHKGPSSVPSCFPSSCIPLLVIQKYKIFYHCYTNDMQLYLCLKLNCPSHINRLTECLEDSRCWITLRPLQLSDNKSEVLFAPWTPLNYSPITYSNYPLNPNPTLPTLGLSTTLPLKLINKCSCQVQLLSAPIHTQIKTVPFPPRPGHSHSSLHILTDRLLQLPLLCYYPVIHVFGCICVSQLGFLFFII